MRRLVSRRVALTRRPFAPYVLAVVLASGLAEPALAERISAEEAYARGRSGTLAGTAEDPLEIVEPYDFARALEIMSADARRVAFRWVHFSEGIEVSEAQIRIPVRFEDCQLLYLQSRRTKWEAGLVVQNTFVEGSLRFTGDSIFGLRIEGGADPQDRHPDTVLPMIGAIHIDAARVLAGPDQAALGDAAMLIRTSFGELSVTGVDLRAPASFDRSEVHELARFRGVTFHAKASFDVLRGELLLFSDVDFEDQVSFERCELARLEIGELETSFRKGANFSDCKLGSASLSAARFSGPGPVFDDLAVAGALELGTTSVVVVARKWDLLGTAVLRGDPDLAVLHALQSALTAENHPAAADIAARLARVRPPTLREISEAIAAGDGLRPRLAAAAAAVRIEVSLSEQAWGTACAAIIGVVFLALGALAYVRRSSRGAAAEPDLSRLGLESIARDSRYDSCFISYSSLDGPFTRKLCRALHEAGVPCWSAHRLEVGAPIRDEIERVISATEKVIVILSESSIGSDWVEHEVNCAREQEGRRGRRMLLPISIDEAVYKCGFGWAKRLASAEAGGVRIGDFSDWENEERFAQSLNELLSALARNSAS